MDKKCSRCQHIKSADCFRTRRDKRRGKECIYLNNTCKKCDCEITKERHQKLKDNPDYIELSRQRARQYHKVNADIIREKNQLKRQTKRYKENRKKYIQKNKEKISQQERITKRRYHEKNRDELTDEYVGAKIVNKTPLKRNEIPPAFIKIKRLEIICIRTLKTIKK